MPITIYATLPNAITVRSPVVPDIPLVIPAVSEAGLPGFVAL